MARWQVGSHRETTFGGVTILDLEQDPIAYFPNPIDVVQFYIPRMALEELAYENHTAIVNTLSWPHCEMDATLKHLGITVLSTIRRCEPAPKVFLDYIGQTILAHATYGPKTLLRNRRIIGFDLNLTHLSVLVEREHDDNPIH